MVNSLARALCVLGIASVGLLTGGCGANPYEAVPVTVKVTCNGKPALGGVVIFEPVDAPDQTGRPQGEPGVTSRGIVGEDGTATLTVDPRGDDSGIEGALVGPHRVSFLPPRTTPARMDPQDAWLPEEEQKALKEELAKIPVFEPLECGTTITPAEVEVTSDGDNVFTFTLSGPPVRPLRQPMRGASD